jgi:hypothetical protein
MSNVTLQDQIQIATLIVQDDGFCTGLDCTKCPATDICTDAFQVPDDDDASDARCVKWMRSFLDKHDVKV